METKTIDLATTPPPHKDASVLLHGNTTDPLQALLLFHGRFASARNILALTEDISLGRDLLVCAPQAKGGQWYPQRFLVPREQNEPHLSSALSVVDELVHFYMDEYNISSTSVVLAGFSQGACLVADYVACNPKRYRGVCIFSGGLIGTDKEIDGRSRKGDLAGTPIYIGSDEDDPHIPAERISSTASAFETMHADVTKRLYSGLGHSVHTEGVAFLQTLVSDSGAKEKNV